MSIVHHTPDIAVVPCLGCDELIAPDDLHRHTHHGWHSCCFMHPFHFWCLRTAPPRPHSVERCAECDAPFEDSAVDEMLEWCATTPTRVHRRYTTSTPPRGRVEDRPENAIPRPALGVRAVAVWWPPGADTSSKPTPQTGVPIVAQKPHPTIPRAFIEARYELAHDVCPVEDPAGFRAQLRAAPGDNAMRLVYADWLEQSGDLVRADFVRAVVHCRRLSGPQAELLDEHLRDVRQALPGSWCRDVVKTS